MTRIQKHLKKLESQRRSTPVTREMWLNWLAHPMTEIFFLSLDIRHIELLTNPPANTDQFWMGYQEGQIKMAEQIIGFEPHDIAEDEQSDD